MDDLAEMQGYADGLASYGITWRVDGMDPLRPEVAIISRNCVPAFQLWRSTIGLLLRSLEPQPDVGVIELPDQNKAWTLVCGLTTPPIWIERERTTGKGLN